MTPRAICLFCGSSTGTSPRYREAAADLGREFAARGVTLVYGAGSVGLMGIAADAALAAGGTVVGVIPRILMEQEVGHRGITELHIVETMHERKALMASRADAFLALPGAFGTADEMFEVLTWNQIGIHSKPVGLLNVSGYFDPLLAWVEHCEKEGFLRPQHRALLRVGTSFSDLLEQFAQPLPHFAKWHDKASLANA
jgi:uncharacterized protein (TIGR00730 family)